MAGFVTVEAGEWTVEEVLAALDEGRRVVVRTELLGATHEVTLRWDGTTYYCDTPTRLHRHATEAAMRGCIEAYGYGRTDGEGGSADADGGADADADADADDDTDADADTGAATDGGGVDAEERRD
jgi:hypothetical protein